MQLPWSEKYQELTVSVRERKCEYLAACRLLGADPSKVLGEVWHELIARAVKESNWQEGLRLDGPRTQHMASQALYLQGCESSPRIDTTLILRQHRRRVESLKRQNHTPEEIGAFNLSAAYYALPLMGQELQSRLTLGVAKAVEDVASFLKLEISEGRGQSVPAHVLESMKKGLDVVEELRTSQAKTLRPLTEYFETEGAYVSRMLQKDLEDLLHPMPVSYIHFLHRLTLAGLYDPALCGRFRSLPVHVGLEDVMFPAPSLVPGLMTQFCKDFPSLLASVTTYDPIRMSARVSYRFVAIHPYLDGNGRISRLLMNLVLWAHGFPPVYLKADKKGRHKYAVALRHANRGALDPLCCLIASSLEEIYSKLVRTVKA